MAGVRLHSDLGLRWARLSLLAPLPPSARREGTWQREMRYPGRLLCTSPADIVKADHGVGYASNATQATLEFP